MQHGAIHADFYVYVRRRTFVVRFTFFLSRDADCARLTYIDACAIDSGGLPRLSGIVFRRRIDPAIGCRPASALLDHMRKFVSEQHSPDGRRRGETASV